MEQATAIIKVLLPKLQWREPDGARRLCLDFGYSPDQNPIKNFPKAVEYQGQTYIRTGFCSDTYTVFYKQGDYAKEK